ncbi:MAG: HAMP domain-containing sensor histidine kinase [Corynebacterium sp.]|nr:HAMP domain-containing sensor histidine kinase [Corynebacterium sp.]
MILRTAGDGQSNEAYNTPYTRTTSLRWQLSLVTACMVALAVGVMTVAAYWILSASLSNSVTTGLENQASSLLAKTQTASFASDPASEIRAFKDYNPDTKVAYFPADSLTGVGDNIAYEGISDVLHANAERSVGNAGDTRVLVRRGSNGAVVVLAKDMASTYSLISSLGVALLVIGGIGVLVAISAGTLAAATGLRSLTRLQTAVNRVTETDDLSPIPVYGSDELAQLTTSFNEMLAALQESRKRQSELVADAGHELKTPLTSLRANIELLMMVTKSGANIDPKDREDLERDVIGQLEELSTLIGDLVDLAREDSAPDMLEPVDLVTIVDDASLRARRRRNDVEFVINTQPWFLDGDPFSLGRCVLNLMDNAAKWSPENGVVRIDMRQLDDSHMELTVADTGPGIPEEDREKVFERFYRSIQSRSMPGSGLGLSIVKSVVERHDGTIQALENPGGGALMRLVLPGRTTLD